MSIRSLLISLLSIILYQPVFSQDTGKKLFFDKQGKACTENVAYYYRIESDTTGYFRCFYTGNGKLCFEGKIKVASANDENKNIYAGACKWYFKNGTIRQSKGFDENGVETGISRYYYESGKIWKELEFEVGRLKNNTFTEYNEDGTRSRIFEEDFNNNSNEWDLYKSDKSESAISNGALEIISTSKEGTSRYINHPVEPGDFSIEATISISDVKDNSGKVGIIYGFKDWQNYHFFVVTKKSIYIGTLYEGVKSIDAEDMYTSAMDPLQNNVLKIITTGEKCYFSINGEIQFKDNINRMFGNNYGFIVSGNSKMKIEKFTIKEINVSGSRGGSPIDVAPTDRDVKATGSGLIFSTSGLILTNHHVIENANRIQVELNSNMGRKTYRAELVVEDRENDLAIIKIKDDSFNNLPQIDYAFKESGLLDVGSSVFTIGYPYALAGMGKDAKFTDGKISSKTGYNGSLNSFQTSIPVQPGNSGGPIFNESGQLIGVINAKLRGGDNVSYGIKLNYVKNLIELLPESVPLPNSTSLNTISLEEKIKILTNYVVLIKIK